MSHDDLVILEEHSHSQLLVYLADNHLINMFISLGICFLLMRSLGDVIRIIPIFQMDLSLISFFREVYVHVVIYVCVCVMFNLMRLDVLGVFEAFHLGL